MHVHVCAFVAAVPRYTYVYVYQHKYQYRDLKRTRFPSHLSTIATSTCNVNHCFSKHNSFFTTPLWTSPPLAQHAPRSSSPTSRINGATSTTAAPLSFPLLRLPLFAVAAAIFAGRRSDRGGAPTPAPVSI